jgi:hypothetical protein
MQNKISNTAFLNQATFVGNMEWAYRSTLASTTVKPLFTDIFVDFESVSNPEFLKLLTGLSFYQN